MTAPGQANTKVTVLGAGGFVGSHAVRDAERRGYEVFAPKRDDPAVFSRPLGHVIYCIGLTADYARRPHATVEAHACVLNRLLERADFDSLVYLSSTRLYDSGRAVGEESNDLVFNPGNPRHVYDLSKGLGESLCHVCGREDTRVARLASVYADDLTTENFLHGLVRQAIAADELELDTAPDYERDYVHVDDVCALLWDIALSGRRRIYNVASGVNVSNADLFEIVGRLAGCRIRPLRPASGASSPRISIEAIQQDFGRTPATPAQRLPGVVAAQRARG